MNQHKKSPQKSVFKYYFSIFLTTFKIGCITFGGGLAMISVIQCEFCEKRKWVETCDIADITAVAQTLPGIVALNTSVLTAYRIGGTLAAVLAGLGSILPSLILLSVITFFYNVFMDNPYVRGALRGISGVVIALFVSTLYKLHKTSLTDWYGVALFVLACVLIFVFPSMNVIFLILGGALSGFILYFLILKKWRTIKDG